MRVSTRTQHQENHSVWYRYFFWQWLFQDLRVTDPWQRAAARAHNFRQRVHLPVYMRRWMGLSVFHFSTGCLLEPTALLLSAAFFCSFAISSCVLLIATVSWVFLGRGA